jgi:hypothetical protein
MAADHPQLGHGGGVREFLETAFDTGGGELRLERGGSLIVPGHPEQPGASAERRGIERHVGGAARSFLGLSDMHHRHRRFR